MQSKSPYVNAVPTIVAQMQEGQAGDQEQQSGQDDGAYHAYPVTLGDVQGVLYTREEVAPEYFTSSTVIDSQEQALDQRPLFIPLIFSLIALISLIAAGLFIPYQQSEVRTTIRVPAILLPLKTLSTSVKIIPTGSKTYPATIARGILTITNGSIVSEELPQGMIVTSTDGIEIVTDQTVFVPPGSATGYGFATVPAHAVVAGATGNIPTLAINQVEGTALYIRNLQPFTGGQNAYTTTFITPKDRVNALNSASTQLAEKITTGMLLHPCTEAVTGTQTVQVAWTCQFVTYHLPAHMKVTGVRLVGKSFLIAVIFVGRTQRIETK